MEILHDLRGVAAHLSIFPVPATKKVFVVNAHMNMLFIIYQRRECEVLVRKHDLHNGVLSRESIFHAHRATPDRNMHVINQFV